MNKYKLTKTYVTHDGSVYAARAALYWESDLPQIVLDAGHAILMESDLDVNTGKPTVHNVMEEYYGTTPNPDIKKEPLYVMPDPTVTIEEEFVKLPSLNSNSLDIPPAVIVPVVLAEATVQSLAALPYVSEKTARKVIEARDSGTVFATTSDLDTAFKLGFGRTWAETSVVV